MTHSMAEFSNSTIRMRISDDIIRPVLTALTGKMNASGTSRSEKIRSSRNDGSCRQAAKNPSTEYWMEATKFRRKIPV